MNNHSKQPHHNKNDVLDWIKEFQTNPSEEIKTKLVLHYESLVQTLARKFSRNQDQYEDLSQVGMIGLLGALARFDTSIGRTFESFAVPTIVGEIKRYLRDKTWSVHVPRRIKELGPKIKRTLEELTNQLQRSPTPDEIAEYLGTTTEEVLETLEMSKSYQALSVDSTIEADQEGGTMTLLDIMGEQDAGFDQINQRLLLDKVFKVLSEREKMILHYTFFKGLSQQETGDQLDISQMHVSRLQRKALQKLKAALKAENSELIL
ncbi:RNA polymerase sigma factor SigB [Bacillus horti]|uniref:RNA polymerase sigma-B factor n=1 Tax=Caldalkalibacillus horti TaxID=77523 RepID=A0ABT9W4T9_9BACI|nr:RNA polymerase sigma factor SigB [Bacillus horti]MDQ0168264.1 RNA polymerase sigma-B factor [Bacillus horti]